MTAAHITSMVLDFYYKGRPKVGSQDLDEKDFEDMVMAAHASILRNLYFLMRQGTRGGELFYFMDSLSTTKETVQKNSIGFFVELSNDIMNLPYGIGVFAVRPITKEGKSSKGFRKAKPGTYRLYDTEEFDGEKFYEKHGKRLQLFNADCLQEGDEIEVDGLHSLADVDIPYDIAWDIFKQVMATASGVKNWPIDTTDNNNPNVDDIKKKLKEAEK